MYKRNSQPVHYKFHIKRIIHLLQNSLEHRDAHYPGVLGCWIVYARWTSGTETQNWKTKTSHTTAVNKFLHVYHLDNERELIKIEGSSWYNTYICHDYLTPERQQSYVSHNADSHIPTWCLHPPTPLLSLAAEGCGQPPLPQASWITHTGLIPSSRYALCRSSLYWTIMCPSQTHTHGGSGVCVW